MSSKKKFLAVASVSKPLQSKCNNTIHYGVSVLMTCYFAVISPIRRHPSLTGPDTNRSSLIPVLFRDMLPEMQPPHVLG